MRELVRVPADPRGQRLRFVVIVERSEISPRQITAQQLYCARFEHQTEQQPPQQPQHEARRLSDASQSRKNLQWGEENRQKPNLEQQRVPLKREEILADRRERQINEP